MFIMKDFKDENEWLEARKQVITATEMAPLLGMNKYQSASKMWAEKQNSTFNGNAYTQIGQILEPAVVNATNLVLGTNFKLVESRYAQGKVMYIDSQLGLGATPDAACSEGLLECKSTKPHNWLRWSGYPPTYYLVQLYTQMLCGDKPWGILSIMSTDLTQKSESLDLNLSCFKIHRQESIDKHILSETARFWEVKREGKTFRSDRQAGNLMELKIRLNMEQLR